MNLILRSWILIISLLISYVISMNNIEEEHNTFETVHTSNAAVLNRLGLTPIEISESHYNKRLSGPEPQSSSSSSSLHYSSAQSRIHQPYSRRHGHHDSHIYVVKLPASPSYYTVTKPVKPIYKYDNKKIISSTNQSGFNNNGKPDKIYHWNLPLMRKINETKRLQTQLRMDHLKKKFQNNNNNNKILKNYDDKKLINSKLYVINDEKLNKVYYLNMMKNNNDKKIYKQTRNNDKLLNYYQENFKESTKVNPIILNKFNNQDNNNIITRKMYRLEDINEKLKFRDSTGNINLLDNNNNNYNNYFDKSIIMMENLKKRHYQIKIPYSPAITYYAPITTEVNGLKSINNNNINKNFSGNGKPKAFYVMEKSRRKPIYYHTLLP